jgi:hypothetical protein
MRRSLSLALLLVAGSALPAAAGHGGAAHVSFHSHSHFVRHFNRFNGFNSSTISFFAGSFGLTSFGPTGVSRFGRSGFSSPWGWGWGGWGLADWDSGGGWSSGGGAPTVIVLAAASPRAAAAPQAPAEASVQTEAGVTVIRGPGSHHLR